MLRAQVRSYVGPEKLAGALYGCDLVLIPAGVPRKPGMTRDDLFNINAGAIFWGHRFLRLCAMCAGFLELRITITYVL